MASRTAGIAFSTAGGAAQGFVSGGPIGGVLGGVAGLVSGIFGADSGEAARNTAQMNAELAYNAGLINSQNIINTGMVNAYSIGAAGQTNAMQQVVAAELSAGSLLQVADYNSELVKATTEFNLSLLANELPKILDAYEIDETHLWQQEARTEGALRAFQGASGTVLDEGSNLDVLIDSRTEALMDSFIIGLQYQWDVQSVADAMNKTAWEGQMQINKSTFEANVQARNIRNQATLNAFTILSNATLDQFTTLNAALADSNTAMNRGIANYNSYVSSGQAAVDEANSMNVVRGIKSFGNAATGYLSKPPSGADRDIGGKSLLSSEASSEYEQANQGSFYRSAEFIP